MSLQEKVEDWKKKYKEGFVLIIDSKKKPSPGSLFKSNIR